MKRASISKPKKHEELSCEFHPTIKINYLRMKTTAHKNLGFFIAIAMLFITGVTLTSSAQETDESRKKILKIYNWADYIDEDLLTEFPVWYKEQTGEDVEIVYQVFDMVEVIYTKIAMGNEDFDLVCPTQNLIERMMHQDLLLPIDTNFGNTPNYMGNISPYFVKNMDAFSAPGKKAGDYMLPYMWGTSGIMYNTNLIAKSEVETWSCFWDAKNKGKMLMKDNYWDVYNMAVIYGSYADITSGKRSIYNVANDHTDADIALVEEKIKQMKLNLAGWEADFGKEMMTKGEIWLGYAWSGDAVWAIQEAADVNVSLDYVVPREGSNIWFDGWVIPKYAGNVKAASYFLNFISIGENALRNMDVSGYTSAIATDEIKEAQIDSSLTETVNLNYFFGSGNDSQKVNPIQYPDSSVVSRCAFTHDFLEKNEKVLEMWSRAKGDNLNNRMGIMILSVIVFLAGWITYRKVKKAQNPKRRTIKK
jgi:spermidine/putrescine transport system substrate-binding protein